MSTRFRLHSVLRLRQSVVDERKAEAARHSYDPVVIPIEEFVEHLHATFDPASCSTRPAT